MSEKKSESLNQIPEFESELKKAKALMSLNEYDKAIKILESLSIKHPDNSPVMGMLGEVHYMAGNLYEALPICQKAVELSPKSSAASMNLFFTQYEICDNFGAFSEIKRFLQIANEEEYDKIMRGVKKSQRGISKDPSNYDPDYIEFLDEHVELINEINTLIVRNKYH